QQQRREDAAERFEADIFDEAPAPNGGTVPFQFQQGRIGRGCRQRVGSEQHGEAGEQVHRRRSGSIPSPREAGVARERLALTPTLSRKRGREEDPALPVACCPSPVACSPICYASSSPSRTTNAATSSTPSPLRTHVKTKGRWPRCFLASRSITSSEAPTWGARSV